VSFRFESPTEVIEIIPSSDGLDSLEIPLDISPASTNLTINLGHIPEGVQVMLIPVNGQNETEENENNFVAAVDKDGKVVFPELPAGSKFNIVIMDDR
jgi:hypothetical protein